MFLGQQLRDQGVGEPVFVAVGGPSAFDDEGAVDLGQDEGEIDGHAVVDADAGGEVGCDGVDVAAEGALAVGGDGPRVLGDVRVGAGRLLVDVDHVVHV